MDAARLAPSTNPIAHAALRLWRIGVLLHRRGLQDDLPAMASALAYKTLLGLIPILVVVTLVAKTLMGAQFAPFVREIIESMGLDRMQIVPPADGAAAAAPVALGDWIETLVRQAAEIDLSALGWVGVAVTVTSAIWLMTSIELSFNRVCHARAGRAWLRRVVLYWFVLTATPLLLAAIPLLSSILSSFRDTPGVGWIAHAAGTVWGVVVLWGLLTLVYLVVPAGRVRVQYAAIGALAAATVIIALKSLLAAYFEHAFAMSRLYGSLGLVPVFMFWLWVVWMAVLSGLEVGLLAQAVGTRGLDTGMAANQGEPPDPAVAVAVMEAAVRDWRAGRPVTRERIAEDLEIDDRLAGEALEAQARAGFLTLAESGAYVPALPPERISAEAVLEAAQACCGGEEAFARAPIALALRRAQRAAAQGRTMAAAADAPSIG